MDWSALLIALYLCGFLFVTFDLLVYMIFGDLNKTIKETYNNSEGSRKVFFVFSLVFSILESAILWPLLAIQKVLHYFLA